MKKKNRKENEFSVLWITACKIYQGTITCNLDEIIFTESFPDEAYYDLICAS